MVSRIVDTFTGRRPPRILVGGSEDIMVRFAKCCNPVPGDDIIGFVTRGRGISIHRCNCTNAALFSEDNERTIEVAWEDTEQKKYPVTLEIIGSDRTGLLQEISRVFAEFKVNIIEGSIKTSDQQARCSFKIEIAHINHLKPVFRSIQHIKGIENVSRVKEYISEDRKET
jgi:GTP pyrophosphokinase